MQAFGLAAGLAFRHAIVSNFEYLPAVKLSAVNAGDPFGSDADLDRDRLVADGIVCLLRRHVGDLLVGEAASAERRLHRGSNHEWDAAVTSFAVAARRHLGDRHAIRPSADDDETLFPACAVLCDGLSERAVFEPDLDLAFDSF